MLLIFQATRQWIVLPFLISVWHYHNHRWCLNTKQSRHPHSKALHSHSLLRSLAPKSMVVNRILCLINTEIGVWWDEAPLQCHMRRYFRRLRVRAALVEWLKWRKVNWLIQFFFFEVQPLQRHRRWTRSFPNVDLISILIKLFLFLIHNRQTICVRNRKIVFSFLVQTITQLWIWRR